MSEKCWNQESIHIQLFKFHKEIHGWQRKICNWRINLNATKFRSLTSKWRALVTQKSQNINIARSYLIVVISVCFTWRNTWNETP
jgi:hypothetical protein